MQLLTRVTAALRLTLRKGMYPCDYHLVKSWSVGQPQPYQSGNAVIIPAFDDGHIWFPASHLVEHQDGRISVGDEIFTCPRQAVQFAISV